MIEVIVPAKLLFDAAKMTRVIENTLNETAQAAKVDLLTPTRTWKHKPSMSIQRGRFERIVGTDDTPYIFVTGGTRVRYATMTPGFQAKSVVRSLQPQAGRGGVAIISKKRPRPGIKAREFEAVVAEKWEKELPVQMQRAIDAEVG